MAPVAALLVAAAGVLAGGNAAVSAQPDTTFVYAGAGSQGIAIELFLPDSVAVNVGDTVEFVNPYEEPHTVTTPNYEGPEFEPGNVGAAEDYDGTEEFNSGLLSKDDHFSITFAETGVFNFLCLLHPGMEIRVNVVAEGEFIPPMGANSPAVQRTIEEGLAVGEAASAQTLAAVNAENAGATDTWVVETGPSVPFEGASVDVMRFLAPELSIPVGGTVEWQNPTFVPHTVTFFNGPPPEDFDPFVSTAPASSTYDPSKFYNAMISVNPAFGGQETFALTFNKAGTYEYVCVLHADQGMVGVIKVGDGGGAITPPSTGDAGLLDRSTGSWLMSAGFATLAMLAVTLAGGLVLARRRA